MLLQFKFDGACNNHDDNPAMGLGIAVFIDSVYYEELSKAIYVPGDELSSSNVGEWMACVEAFKLILEYKEAGDTIEVYSDSQLITNQYNDKYEIKKNNFRQYYHQAKILAEKAGLQDLKVKWVKREFNKEADKLSKIALKQYNNVESV